jgi:hypothetical protein
MNQFIRDALQEKIDRQNADSKDSAALAKASEKPASPHGLKPGGLRRVPLGQLVPEKTFTKGAAGGFTQGYASSRS